jgi:arabinogalactan oligomer / maltooligosaccharide transport system permease protein
MKPALAGAIFKVVFLSLASAGLGYLAFVAFLAGEYIIGGVLSAVLLGIFVMYTTRRAVPGKFLYPGIVFLVIFTIVPIVYTQVMSLYVYKSGNLISKSEAIVSLEKVGLVQDPLNTTYQMQLGFIGDDLAAVLVSDRDGTTYLASSREGTEAVEAPNEPALTELIDRAGFRYAETAEIARIGEGLTQIQFDLGEGWVAIPQSFRTAARLTQKFVFDDDTGFIFDTTTNEYYADNGKGNFASLEDPNRVLFPGWRAFDPLVNYTSLFTNPNISGPFAGVFIWTIFFAVFTVVSMFAVGLLLAIALDRKIRFRGFYRSVLILPYAMPSLMSILIWAGMFNREFGAVNRLFDTEIFWLGDPVLAKIVILIVNLWLGFPYFYLITTGALQAMPAELEEAAAIDGARPSQIFFSIKLPLLLQMLAPLIIASFAFNFNNFNIVYLLTQGGPTDVLSGQKAGATDILITYTYKTAFTGTEQNLGLASAISVIMFIIVGLLSLWSLRRSKVLEEMR